MLKVQGGVLFWQSMRGENPVRSHTASSTAQRWEEILGGHSLAGNSFHLLSIKRSWEIGPTVLKSAVLMAHA